MKAYLKTYAYWLKKQAELEPVTQQDWEEMEKISKQISRIENLYCGQGCEKINDEMVQVKRQLRKQGVKVF